MAKVQTSDELKNGIPFFPPNINEKTRGKHPNCPGCGGRMKRLYVKSQYCKMARWVGVGWLCPNCLNVELGEGER